MLDLPLPQIAAVAARRVGLVAAEVIRPGPRASAFETGNADTFHDRDELWGIPPLARRDQERKRATSALTGKVYLASQSAPGASEFLIGAVLPRP